MAPHSPVNLNRQMVLISLRSAKVPGLRGRALVLDRWLDIVEPPTRRALRRELVGLPLGPMLLFTAASMVPMLALVFVWQVALPQRWEPAVTFTALTVGVLPASAYLCWWVYVTWLAFTSDLAGMRARLSRPMDGLLWWLSVAGVGVAVVMVAVIFAINPP